MAKKRQCVDLYVERYNNYYITITYKKVRLY